MAVEGKSKKSKEETSDKNTKSKKSVWTFGFPVKSEETKNTDNYDYIVYNEEEVDQYYEQLLGNLAIVETTWPR